MDDVQHMELNAGAGSSLDLSIPGICEGYLMKRRKYPLKGWHKVTLSKCAVCVQMMRGKLHGSMDVSRAVMSINKKLQRIDLDAGDNIYHVKAKSNDIFYIWLTKLCAHRIFKKNEAMSVHKGVLQAMTWGQSSLPPMGTMSQPVRSTGANSKVSAWLQQTQDIDATSNELARCQAELTDMAQLIQRLHWLEGGLPITNTDLEMRISMQNLTLEKPKKKTGKGFGHSRTLSRPDVLGEMYPAGHLDSTASLGTSVPSIPGYVYSQLSKPQATSPEAKKLHQEICAVSQRVHTSLRSVHEVLTLERERLRQAWTGPDLQQNTSQQLATLCSTLSEFDIQSRLTKVHSFSLSSDSSDESFCTVQQVCTASPALSSVPVPSSALGGRVFLFFFSAGCVHVPGQKTFCHMNTTRRRTTLPAHCADNSHIGVMSILYNNIGKDLSRVSMPVALNEPLCLLQRVSEELEYTELLDTANHTDDPYIRMVYMAAFSISGYAWATWRNRYKPFNPVLGETYENLREDRGFRYISEQVCHHPPVSACHAESENFTFWQDQRWKHKFWGKSLEIISSGPVHVTLPRYDDHYVWDKVVTCIHNVLTQHRTLEHYGEYVITNKNSDVCTCKVTFVKARYWSPSNTQNEVQGEVLDRTGNVVHHFGGFWHEGIFCETLPTPACIWKPHEQPEDYAQYYGFSRYARELNELTPQLQKVLPPTDTRFRPDQRLLEEGKVTEADKKKEEVEQKQRESRKELTKRKEQHMPRFFNKSVDDSGQEVWLYNGTYWKTRDNPGFAATENLDLWC
uniref:Oxysterol-binding protein n=1 Tax=Neogobius melanostomus TaxID=47308 RepID=A0A8C6U9M0_9GOBI